MVPVVDARRSAIMEEIAFSIVSQFPRPSFSFFGIFVFKNRAYVWRGFVTLYLLPEISIDFVLGM